MESGVCGNALFFLQWILTIFFVIDVLRLKASRARKLLQKKAVLKEEKKAAAIAAGLDWHSDDSNDESEVIYRVYLI